MAFLLTPKNTGCDDQEFHQSAWPPIWRWLCRQHGALGELFASAGCINGGLIVKAEVAERFAEILRAAQTKKKGPPELYVIARMPQEGTRVDRLIQFFENCGGFEIW